MSKYYVNNEHPIGCSLCQGMGGGGLYGIVGVINASEGCYIQCHGCVIGTKHENDPRILKYISEMSY